MADDDDTLAGSFAAMSDAEIESRLAATDKALAEDSPEAVDAFLASLDGREGSSERVNYLRRVFDDVRDWNLGHREAYTAELARRREAAKAHSRQKAPGGLHFGPWRGFNPLA